MSKPSDIRLTQVVTSTEKINYRTPIKFGGRVVSDVVLLNVTVDVETRDGRRGQGFGSMPMGNVWGWPSRKASGEQTLSAMIALSKALAGKAEQYNGMAHPLEITHELACDNESTATEVTSAAGLSEPMPPLAQLVCASPLEAAIHDAYGKALGENSYNLLGESWANCDLSTYLGNEFSGEYLDRYTLREPKDQMPIYHLVGALDPLFEGDLEKRLNDGMPETLGEWIEADGLTHLKIKLSGEDMNWDIERVAGVERAAVPVQEKLGRKEWRYSLDFNEKCAHVEYVLDFLEKLRRRSAVAFQRVQYIEQPTARDLKANPENRMHRAAEIKPVVIDESLIDLESLLIAREQGYSGVALKACKGHSEALLMGAAAQKYGMFLCVQDLTCPGYSFLHSASIAARIPTIAAIEGNGRQYCPAGNEAWKTRFPSMFDITDGTVGTGVLSGNGLGF